MAQTILVAEDEMFLAFDLCETVEEAGYEVDGPHAGISSAMLAFQKEKPDLAILDVRLADGVVYPLARKLEADNIPIIFHSGEYSSAEMMERFPNCIALEKPCPPTQMLKAVSEALTMANELA